MEIETRSFQMQINTFTNNRVLTLRSAGFQNFGGTVSTQVCMLKPG
jgi:hypothetical protein